jgi:hypothetical protein
MQLKLCNRSRVGGAHNVAAAVLWRKRQSADRWPIAETKPESGNFPIMLLAITGQWVGEVTMVLCLFGAACIGVAMMAGDGESGRAPPTAEQKATERIRGRRSEDADQS